MAVNHVDFKVAVVVLVPSKFYSDVNIFVCNTVY